MAVPGPNLDKICIGIFEQREMSTRPYRPLSPYINELDMSICILPLRV